MEVAAGILSFCRGVKVFILPILYVNGMNYMNIAYLAGAMKGNSVGPA